MKRRLLLLGLAALGEVRAKTADDGAARRRLAIEISKELRDPTSVNETLFESESAVSGEIKAEIYAQLARGRSRREIVEFFAERYGDSIRYEPAMKSSTVVLWTAPWLLVAAAAVAAFRRRSDKARK